MQSPRGRALLGVASLAVVVVLFIVLSGGGDDESTSTVASSTTSTTETLPTEPDGGPGDKPDKPDEPDNPEIPTIVVVDGQPEGGVQELTFTEGDDIRFRVESDIAEEIHFHGYELAEEVAAGGSVEFDVPATITGQFEVELEHSVVPIAEITVNPS